MIYNNHSTPFVCAESMQSYAGNNNQGEKVKEKKRQPQVPPPPPLPCLFCADNLQSSPSLNRLNSGWIRSFFRRLLNSPAPPPTLKNLGATSTITVAYQYFFSCKLAWGGGFLTYQAILAQFQLYNAYTLLLSIPMYDKLHAQQAFQRVQN